MFRKKFFVDRELKRFSKLYYNVLVASIELAKLLKKIKAVYVCNINDKHNELILKNVASSLNRLYTTLSILNSMNVAHGWVIKRVDNMMVLHFESWYRIRLNNNYKLAVELLYSLLEEDSLEIHSFLFDDQYHVLSHHSKVTKIPRNDKELYENIKDCVSKILDSF